MAQRDQSPYMEGEDQRPDGTELLAIHNLTAAEIDLMRSALRERRSRNAELLTHATTTGIIATRLRSEMDTIDTITLLMHLRA